MPAVKKGGHRPKKGKGRNAWMREPRTWVVYAMTPDATGYTWKQRLKDIKSADGSRRKVHVYLGMTSVGLPTRLRQHKTDAHARRSECPLHREMRRLGENRQWYVHELEKLSGSTYQQAKRRERAIKAKYSTYPGFKVLNRTTLSCD